MQGFPKIVQSPLKVNLFKKKFYIFSFVTSVRKYAT